MCEDEERDFAHNPDVKQNLEGFLFATVDKDSNDAQKYLPSVRYTPTIFFISQDFHVVNTVKGYLNAYDFNMWVDDTRKKLNLPIIGSVKKSDESNYVQPEENSIWMYDIASAIDFCKSDRKKYYGICRVYKV